MSGSELVRLVDQRSAWAVRVMSLLRFPGTRCKLPAWMQLGFLAGHDFGRAHPESLEDVLPGLELREAARRVGVVQQHSGEEHLTFTGLQHACARIVEAQWAEVPEDKLESLLLEVIVKSLRTGFAAGTVAHLDPTRCEFVWDMPERIGSGITDVVSRTIVGAPLNVVGKSVADLLEHPLITLAREYYPRKKVECDTALGFFREQLRALGVKSENECPASELAF